MAKLLSALLVFTLFTILLGSWVRNAGAGLSCPDWPLCHGQIIPPMEFRIMLEYFHRLAAALVGFLLLGAFVWSMVNARYRRELGALLSVAMVLLIVQVVLGMLTVTRLLQWEVVAMHLGTASLLFCVLLISVLKSLRIDGSAGEPDTLKIPTSFFWAARASLLFVFVQIMLGGSVSSNYAGLACPDFPTCHGSWFPGFSGQVGIHFIHRLGAVIVTIVLTVFLLQWRHFRGARGVLSVRFPCLIGALLVIQWLLGIGMILFGVGNNLTIPAPLAVGHLAIAILILSLILTAYYECKNRRLS